MRTCCQPLGSDCRCQPPLLLWWGVAASRFLMLWVRTRCQPLGLRYCCYFVLCVCGVPDSLLLMLWAGVATPAQTASPLSSAVAPSTCSLPGMLLLAPSYSSGLLQVCALPATEAPWHTCLQSWLYGFLPTTWRVCGTRSTPCHPAPCCTARCTACRPGCVVPCQLYGGCVALLPINTLSPCPPLLYCSTACSPGCVVAG